MAGFKQIILAIFIATSIASALAFNQEIENVRSLMKLLSIPQKPDRYFVDVKPKYPQPDIPTLSQYSWKTCGTASDPVKATLALSPDPLPVPGTITVSGNATLSEDIDAPVKLSLNIQKKVIVWITIPCIDNIGSCTYDDVCEMLKEKFPDSCPAPLSTYSLPCNCPFKNGTYSLPPSPIDVEVSGIPSWLTSGDYKISAKATDSSGKELACYDVAVSLN